MKQRLIAVAMVALACFIALTRGAYAETMLLEGRIGEAPVVMEIDTTAGDSQSPGSVAGRYFHRKNHLDIPFFGERSGGGFVIYEGSRRDYEDAKKKSLLPRIFLRGNDNEWQGERQAAGKKKALPVALNRIPLPLPKEKKEESFLSKLRADSPYQYLRQAGLALKPQNRQTFMGYSLQWWKEPVSGIRSFTLLSGYDEATRARLNRVLLDRLWEDVSDYHSCRYGVVSQWNASQERADFKVTITPTFLGSDVLSAKHFTSYDCGGAHPDFYTAGFNVRASDGSHLALEDVIRLGTGGPKWRRNAHGKLVGEDEAAYRRYEKETLTPWLAETLKKLYPAKFGSGTQKGKCDYAAPDVWSAASTAGSWFLTRSGIWFGASFPRFQRSCDSPEWAIIPWSIAGQHPGLLTINLPR